MERFRQGRGEFYFLLGYGVAADEGHGVKKLRFDFDSADIRFFFPAVEFVGDDGMPDGRHVHPYLVRAAGLES